MEEDNNLVGTPTFNLQKLVSNEQEKVKHALNQSRTPYFDLVSILRQLDLFYISYHTGGQSSNLQAQKMLEFYRYGWYEAFAHYIPILNNLDSQPVFPSNINAQSWADSVLGVAGKINMVSRQLALANAGLINIEQISPNSFITKFKYEIAEKEHYDRESFDFIQKIALNTVKERYDNHTKTFERIEGLLPNIIQNPYGKFIAYKATEEIENYYREAGYFHILKEQGYEEFDEDDLFGGVKYKLYLDCVSDIAAGTLMHIDCCFALSQKNPSVNPYDIFTYNWYIDKKIEQYATHFGINKEIANQIFACLILNAENYHHYKNLKGSVPAPFIQTGKNQYARSIYGALHGSIDFLKRELKRRYEKDYFKAVNGREKRFRNILYKFFPQERLVKIEKEIVIKYDGLHTDIDAVVFDHETKSLGLFQLKWQDTFFSSPTERFSRISNLFPKAIEWIDKVQKWISDYSKDEIITKLTLDKYGTQEVGEIYLFVIARNHVHFTGIELDDRAAWASMNQVPYSLSRIKTMFDDPIRELHLKLKMDAPEERVKREGYPELINYKIELESFTID